MTGLKKWIMMVTAAVLMAGFIACEEKGPMEKLGEKADKAVKEVEKAVEKAAQ